MTCEHKPIFDYAAPAFAAVRCENCRKRWAGNPQAKNAPRWVKDRLNAAIDAVKNSRR